MESKTVSLKVAIEFWKCDTPLGYYYPNKSLLAVQLLSILDVGIKVMDIYLFDINLFLFVCVTWGGEKKEKNWLQRQRPKATAGRRKVDWMGHARPH